MDSTLIKKRQGDLAYNNTCLDVVCVLPVQLLTKVLLHPGCLAQQAHRQRSAPLRPAPLRSRAGRGTESPARRPSATGPGSAAVTEKKVY